MILQQLVWFLRVSRFSIEVFLRFEGCHKHVNAMSLPCWRPRSSLHFYAGLRSRSALFQFLLAMFQALEELNNNSIHALDYLTTLIKVCTFILG